MMPACPPTLSQIFAQLHVVGEGRKIFFSAGGEGSLYFMEWMGPGVGRHD